MNYTLDRFPAKEDVPVLEAFEGLKTLSVMAGNLERLLENLGTRRRDRKQAAKAMQAVIKMAEKVEASTTEESSTDLLGSLLGKVLKFIGKKIIKAIVRPILRFAAETAMNMVRIAARTVMRFVLVPIFEAVVGFAVANPVTAAILGVGALAAGGYALYKKYFAAPEVEEVEVTPTAAVVEGAPAETLPEQPQAKTPENKVEEVVSKVRESEPIKAVERFISQPKIYKEKPRTGKFKGFGSDVDQYIREASARYPILPIDVLRGFVKMEAGWTGAMSPTGAIGTGQFTAGPWNALISQGGSEIGMTPITGIYGEEKDKHGKPIRPHVQPNPKGNFRTENDPRFDKRINTLATALLASKNAEMLKRAGLPVTGANLYMMHNIGPGIIPVMKGAPASAATLKAMRQNGMVSDMTDREFLEFQKKRFESAYQESNTSTELVSDQPRMAAALTTEPKPRTPTKAGPTATPGPLAQTNSTSNLIKGVGNSIVRI